MSLVEPQHPTERRPLPGINVNLPTNNPFRRGPNSPSLNSPGLQSDRPPSRNPFLDQSAVMSPNDATRPSQSPPKSAYSTVPSTLETTGLLKSMTIGDRVVKNENMPPPPPLRNGHRSTRSQEEEQEKGGRRVGGLDDTLDIFADPQPVRRPPGQHRQRRNSDSSVADRQSKSFDPEEEKKRRERRHRERAHRQLDSKGRPIPSSSRNKRPNHRLDVIDKLDVTSIFGTGAFHHDGPFDACNPHRNRKGASRAPMQAFPKDSANNVIGGSGPVHKKIDLAQYHGHGEDSFADFNTTVATKDAQPAYEPYSGATNGTDSEAQYRGDARPGAGVNRTSAFVATAKVKKLHGDESLGLGTSTFLEGAPAPRVAIQRRESEEDGGGLGRKRSLAQKIRGINNVRVPRSQGVYSPEPRFERTTSPEGVQSAGGLPKITEANPFFQDYDDEYEKKGASIRVAEEKLAGEGEASTPRPTDGLRRTLTEGSGGFDSEGKAGSGFLSRVKSLRGGKRTRPERRD